MNYNSRSELDAELEERIWEAAQVEHEVRNILQEMVLEQNQNASSARVYSRLHHLANMLIQATMKGAAIEGKIDVLSAFLQVADHE